MALPTNENIQAQNSEDTEKVKTLQADILEFIEERHKQCGQASDKEMIRFATLLIAENRENRAILGLLHKGELEIEQIEGTRGDSSEDYRMRLIKN